MARYNEYTGTEDGTSKSASREYVVANGVTLTVGDMVYLSNGFVTNAAIAGKRLVGQVIGGDSTDLDRANSATVVGDGTRTALVEVERSARYLMESDEATATLAATDIGKYFDLTGATGVQQVDVSSGSATTGQVLYIANANGIRGTDETFGIFTIAEDQSNL